MQNLPSFWNLIDKYKASIILGLVGLILVGLGLIFPRLGFSKPEPEFIPASESKEETKGEIMVDVAGAVLNPDVYSLDDGSRIQDAIKAAGGMIVKADKDWVAKNLNLAQLIGDGTKIYIPRQGEINKISNTSSASPDLASNSSSGLVNINTASESELDVLPQIGPVTAQKIISGRPYSSVEDLSTKNILGPKTYEGLKDLVSVQ